MLRAFGQPVQHMSQHYAAMLQDVALKCCKRLARPLLFFVRSIQKASLPRALKRGLNCNTAIDLRKNETKELIRVIVAKGQKDDQPIKM